MGIENERISEGMHRDPGGNLEVLPSEIVVMDIQQLIAHIDDMGLGVVRIEAVQDGEVGYLVVTEPKRESDRASRPDCSDNDLNVVQNPAYGLSERVTQRAATKLWRRRSIVDGQVWSGDGPVGKETIDWYEGGREAYGNSTVIYGDVLVVRTKRNCGPLLLVKKGFDEVEYVNHLLGLSDEAISKWKELNSQEGVKGILDKLRQSGEKELASQLRKRLQSKP